MRTRLFLLLAFSSLSAAWAFQTPTSSSASHHAVHSRPSLVVVHGRMTPLRHNQHDSPKSLLPLHQSKTSTSSSSSSSWTTVAARTATTTALLWLGSLQLAVADSPDWGVLEGRTGSLLHPIMMGSLLLYSLYTGYLGLQWRRQRTAGDEIKRLQAALPKLDDKKDNEETPDPAVVAQRQAGQAEIAALQQQRKDLAAAGPRDRHYSQGALLAFLGTAFAIEGPLNTYARAGKLFPGPHLYVGAGLVCIWALAAATVPAMTKGNATARKLHIGANLTGLALFAWQLTTGLPILFKVIENTSWP